MTDATGGPADPPGGRVVATAGHVDHGKSTLVQALTGIDPDRWEEEKRRGLTIDLGFAWTNLPSGRVLTFVDVPGHVRFLKNMLAGVGGVDACLFVVAADDGWMPQSEEHLRILELLGVTHGVVALTKVGVVDEDHAELARMEVVDRTAGSFLQHAELVPVDAPTGVGLAALRAALDRLSEDAPAAVDRGRPRLWIDRAFGAKGAGTVVTGTLTGGALAVDDTLLLTPAGRPVRVRALQTRQAPVERIGPGNRVAVNVTGPGRLVPVRGDALVRPGQWHLTRRIDARLDVLPSVGHDVSRRGAYAAYVGAGEHPVRLRVLGGPEARIAPGTSGLVRLHLPVDLPLTPGDRFVLRDFGRSETVGGGEVLDVDPVLPAARARPDRSADRVVAERGWVDADELARLTGESREPTVGRWVVDPDTLAGSIAAVRAAVASAGPLGLDVAGLDERQRAVLNTLGDVVVAAGRARAGGGGGAADDPLAGHPFVAALEASPFAPPSPEEAGVDRAELRELVRRGAVVEADGTWFAPSAIEAAGRAVARLLAESPEGVTVSAVRDVLGTTRRFAVPLLAHLDATGVTRRRGDLRIPGPRLPAP